MAKNINYKKELDKYMKKAQNTIKDSEKLEDLIHQAEEKLKTIPTVGEGLSYIPTFLDMLRCYVTGEYREIPTGTLIALCAMMLYFISPIDLIPDFIPIVGLLDDAGIAIAGLTLVKSDLDIFMNWRKNKPIDVTAKPKKAVRKVVKQIETKTKPIKKKVIKTAVKVKAKQTAGKVKKATKKATKKVKKALDK